MTTTTRTRRRRRTTTTTRSTSSREFRHLGVRELLQEEAEVLRRHEDVLAHVGDVANLGPATWEEGKGVRRWEEREGEGEGERERGREREMALPAERRLE